MDGVAKELGEDVCEPGARDDVVELACRDQRIDGCGPAVMGARVRAGEGLVAAPDRTQRNRTNRPRVRSTGVNSMADTRISGSCSRCCFIAATLLNNLAAPAWRRSPMQVQDPSSTRVAASPCIR